MISLLIVKKELRRSLKNKRKLILTFLLPLLSIILAIMINNMMKPSINLGIVENNHVNKEVEERINTVKEINTSKVNEKAINTDMILGKYLGVIEFKGENKLKVYCLDKNMKVALEEAVSEIISTGKVNKTKELLNILDEGSLDVAERGNVFILIVLIITCTMSASTILKDREEGLIRRYSIAPNKVSFYILGNYIYNLINTVLQILLGAIVLYLLNIDMGISFSNFIIIGIVISMVASSIATLVTIISKGELQANLLASAMALIMALLGGGFLPTEKMPNMLKIISNLSITKWIIELTSSARGTVTYGDNFVLVLVIILLSVIITFIALKIGERSLGNNLKENTNI